MPTFQYKAITPQGHKIEEKIEANSQVDAMIEIDRKGLTLLEIRAESKWKSYFTKNSVSKKELSLFAKQLSYLVGTGVALHRGVEIIGEQTKNTYFKSILSKVIQDIKEGVPISQCLAKHPSVFPESMIFQVRAAESGGFMQETLMNISFNFQRDAEFSSKVRGAMTYPVAVLVIAIGIVYFMLSSVVPKMSGTLEGFDAELPQLTKVIMAVSNFVTGFWYLLFGGLGIIAYVFYILLQDESKLKIWHSLLIKIPVLGRLIVSVNIARMSRVMSSLLSSGVPIDDTLDNVSNVVTNRVVRDNLKTVKLDVVEQGISLSKALEMKSIFPKTLVQIVSVGEESGNLAEVLKNYAENIEEEVESLLKTTTNLINPMLMIVIGAIVAVIVLSLFMPMFSLMDKF